MSLTFEEQKRIYNIEVDLQKLQKLNAGAASEDMLNRLLALSNEEIVRLTNKVTELTAELNTLLDKVNKL